MTPQTMAGQSKGSKILCSVFFFPLMLLFQTTNSLHLIIQNRLTFIPSEHTPSPARLLLLFSTLTRFQELTPHFNVIALDASFFPSFL